MSGIPALAGNVLVMTGAAVAVLAAAALVIACDRVAARRQARSR